MSGVASFVRSRKTSTSKVKSKATSKAGSNDPSSLLSTQSGAEESDGATCPRPRCRRSAGSSACDGTMQMILRGPRKTAYLQCQLSRKWPFPRLVQGRHKRARSPLSPSQNALHREVIRLCRAATLRLQAPASVSTFPEATPRARGRSHRCHPRRVRPSRPRTTGRTTAASLHYLRHRQACRRPRSNLRG